MSVAQVAKMAGVSTATVSRVINDHPNVSARAIKTVSDVIEQLNYHPRKPARRSTVTPQSREKRRQRKLAALALVMPDLEVSFFPSLVRSFESTARDAAHQVLICNTENSVAKQADILVQLIEHGVAGVALMSPSTSEPFVHQIRLLERCGVAVVLLHREVESASASVVALPYERLGRRAVEALADFGHRRIALVISNKSPTSQAYERGARQALTDHRLPLTEDWIYRPPQGEVSTNTSDRVAAIEAQLDRLLNLPAEQRPTALFANWEGDAQLLLLLLLSRGVRVPEDISIITSGSAWRNDPVNSRLAAITIDEVESGRIAVELLMARVNGDKSAAKPQRRVLELGLHRGQTLGHAPGVASHQKQLLSTHERS